MTSPSPFFDRQTSPQADPRCRACQPAIVLFAPPASTNNLDNEACLLDPPLIMWDRVSAYNCVVLDCFASRMYEETTYWQLQLESGVAVWRQDHQVEEAHE